MCTGLSPSICANRMRLLKPLASTDLTSTRSTSGVGGTWLGSRAEAMRRASFRGGHAATAACHHVSSSSIGLPSLLPGEVLAAPATAAAAAVALLPHLSHLPPSSVAVLSRVVRRSAAALLAKTSKKLWANPESMATAA